MVVMGRLDIWSFTLDFPAAVVQCAAGGPALTHSAKRRRRDVRRTRGSSGACSHPEVEAAMSSDGGPAGRRVHRRWF